MTNGEVLLGLTTVGIGAAGLFYLSRQKPVTVVTPPPQAPPTPTGLAASQAAQIPRVPQWRVRPARAAAEAGEASSFLPAC